MEGERGREREREGEIERETEKKVLGHRLRSLYLIA